MASATTVAREPDLAKFYGRRLSSIRPGEFDFLLDLIRGPNLPPLNLDRVVVGFEWNDEESSMSGNVRLKRPDPSNGLSLPIAEGHQVRCRTKWEGRTYELWTMRCAAPEPAIETADVSVDLKDDMDTVRRNRTHYVFRKTKRRPRGFFGHEILRDAARRDGIRLGALTTCTKRMPHSIDFHGSFLDLAVKVYENERKQTGSRFILRMRDGRFEAVPYKRNVTLYVFEHEIRSGSVTRALKKESPTTVITGTGHVGKGKAAKKVRHVEYRTDVVRRLGFKQREKDYGRVDSLDDLKRQVQRDLADELTTETTVTLQSQGLPFLRRGDGAQVIIESERLTGPDSFVFATGVRHQVQGATYTVQADFTGDDAFEAERERREKELRAKARARRKAKKAAS